jgi:nuclear cap-binding protein subunit 2
MASQLFASGKEEPDIYWDRKYFATLADQIEALDSATTLYVGNLSFFTTEAQMYELFSTVGHVKRVIMGLDKFKKTPCGFCFVEYDDHASAIRCRDFISHTKLDDREIRCEIDSGFIEGRQYGRGASGGQVTQHHKSRKIFINQTHTY